MMERNALDSTRVGQGGGAGAPLQVPACPDKELAGSIPGSEIGAIGAEPQHVDRRGVATQVADGQAAVHCIAQGDAVVRVGHGQLRRGGQRRTRVSHPQAATGPGLTSQFVILGQTWGHS